MTGIVHIYASQRVVGMRTIRYKVEHAGIYDSAHLIFHGPSVHRKIGVSYYSKI